MKLHYRTLKRAAAKRARDQMIRQRDRANLNSELNRFWLHCNFVDYSEFYKLARLKSFAEVVISGSEKASKRRRARERFNHSNYRLERICFVCSKAARVRHHIIQAQHGGANIGTNIIPLCEECHAAIHPWLKTPAVNKPQKMVNKSKRFVNNSKPPNASAICAQLLTESSQGRHNIKVPVESYLPKAEHFLGLSL